MTLSELAESYRATADMLRHRIQLVEELPVRTEAEAIAKAERLRILEAMRRDVRDVAANEKGLTDPVGNGIVKRHKRV